MNSELPSIVSAVRWSARLLSILILFFWGFFLVAHVMGDDAKVDNSFFWRDIIALTALLTSIGGLLVAWKWEFSGAAFTILAVLVGAIINPYVLVFPGTMIPITAALFLSCWWMTKNEKRST